VIELSSESSESWEDATRQAVERASRTIRNIRSVWVKEFAATVDSNNVMRVAKAQGDVPHALQNYANRKHCSHFRESPHTIEEPR
jgi:flavin-binding protein dodecin